MYWLISQSRMFTFVHEDSYSNTDQILFNFSYWKSDSMLLQGLGLVGGREGSGFLFLLFNLFYLFLSTGEWMK